MVVFHNDATRQKLLLADGIGADYSRLDFSSSGSNSLGVVIPAD